MKLLIVDHPAHHDYTISGGGINGIDLSVFPADATFKGNADTDAAGIHNQRGLLYECAPVNGSHDWFGTGEWIDAADYDPDQCYLVATAAPDNASYEKRPDGWTVTVPVVEEPELIEEEKASEVVE